MGDLLDAKYLLIDILICEIREAPLIFVDHKSIIKSSKIWVFIKYARKKKNKKKME